MTLLFRVLNKIWNGIASGCVYLCFYILFVILTNGNTEQLNFHSFAFIQAMIVSIIMGLGFNLPTLVYCSTKLPLWKKLLVHLTLGMTVFFTCIFTMGWYPQNSSVFSIILFVLIGFAIFFLFWAAFYSYFYILQKAEAKTINDSLKKMEQQNK